MRKSMNLSINKPEFDKLLHDRYEGNIEAFANDIGMSKVHTYKVLNEKAKPGAEFLYGVTQFCEQHELKSSIFFEQDNSLKNQKE